MCSRNQRHKHATVGNKITNNKIQKKGGKQKKINEV